MIPNIELHNNDFLVHESHNKDPPVVESNNINKDKRVNDAKGNRNKKKKQKK